jgi:hypothetical protein
VFAPAVSAQDITIPVGTDLLYTQPGSFAILPGPVTVPVVGNPVLAGGADTSVDRLADADATLGTAIGTQLTSLNLLGTGTFSNLSITLDPAHLAQDTGTMSFLTVGPTLPGTQIGGTITDTLTVWYQATLSGAVVASGTETFTSKGTWEAFLPAGANEVTNFKIILDIHVDPVNGQHVVSSFSAVPEPSSWILCAMGGLAVPAYAGWRRRQQTRVGQ